MNSSSEFPNKAKPMNIKESAAYRGLRVYW